MNSQMVNNLLINNMLALFEGFNCLECNTSIIFKDSLNFHSQTVTCPHCSSKYSLYDLISTHTGVEFLIKG